MLCCPRLPTIHWTVRPLEPLPPDERTSYPVQRRASVLHPQEYLLHRQGVAPVPVMLNMLMGVVPAAIVTSSGHTDKNLSASPWADKGRQQ